MAYAISVKIHNLPSLLPSFSSSSLSSQKWIKNNDNNKAYSSSYYYSIDTRISNSFQVMYRFSASEDDEDEDENCSFEEAVALFNNREFYKCHDCLETLWNSSQEPTRTLIHGILQCAVGFFHLFNQNHKGAMMELGEGLCKLRKMNFANGPFHQFEMEISATLDFIYRTQLELAACTEDLCVTMDRSERCYQLLGDYAAGQHIYHLETNPFDGFMYLVFQPTTMSCYDSDKSERLKVKLPTLNVTQTHLKVWERS